ncbi:MAG: glycosyl hydrolase family 18 protein, partial [Rudaea sp.]
ILPNTDGSIDTTFYLGGNGATWAQSAVTAAHAAGRKAILMVGGAGEISGWEGAASSANRSAFVANLLGAVSNFGADGLDLDWEPISDIDDASILALVQALRNSGPPGLILTMPVGSYNQNLGWQSGDPTLFASLYPLLDQINLMSYGNAYDYSGWYSWFSSALAGEAGNYPIDIASSIGDYEGFGVPAAKLGVGIGAYGLCFTGVTQPRQATNSGDVVSNDDNTMTYAHIVSAYIPGMTYTYDATAKSPWLSHATPVGSPGCTYVTYEDPTSIADKGAWALAHGLGGTIVWTIAEGHLGNGNDPLLDAAHAAFP